MRSLLQTKLLQYFCNTMEEDLRLTSYNYDLPAELIAQQPADKRENSRLMVLDTVSGRLRHKRFTDIVNYLRPGDLLVRNNSRVFPARLLGTKETGGRVEMLLLHYPGNAGPAEKEGWRETDALTLIRSSKRPRPGMELYFSSRIRATVRQVREDGKVEVLFSFRPDQGKTLNDLLTEHGEIPLPPYIARPEGSLTLDRRRYQTCYASRTGSVAAPTAGLHFSDELLGKIADRGVETAEVTLHVGYGTFAPVRTQTITEHRIHHEYVEISEETAARINRARQEGRRIWAVGTTTVRALEFAADSKGKIRPLQEDCDLFIYPGFRFRIIDNLITNFHLPQSSLLFLVAALTGRKVLLDAYQEAIERNYRFFSYGDAMAILQKS